MKNKIYYFDNAATSFPKPDEVAVSVFDTIKNYSANPGRSSHKLAIESGRVVFNTRENIAELMCYEDSENFVFTLNATDGLNIILNGFLKENSYVLTSFIEHNSVLRPLNFLKEKRNIKVDFIKFSMTDGIDFDDFNQKLKEKVPDLVVLNHASNVTGKIINLLKVLELKRKYKFRLLIDAAQTGGIIEYDLKDHPIDFIAFTGHKGFLGPQGVGFLFIRDKDIVQPFRCGGTGSLSEKPTQPLFLPDKFESGTLNVPGIAGLNEGINFIKKVGLKNIFSHKSKLVAYFIEKLKLIDNVKIYSDLKDNAGVVSINLEKLSPSKVSEILDKKYNIATRPGLHCAPLIHQKLGTFPHGTVRFSFSYFNSMDEIDYAINALKEIIRCA